MLKLLLALHLVFAVFAIGPLAHAATTAARGIRHGDGAATKSSARVLRIYAYVSVLVVGAGFALMSQKRPSIGFISYSGVPRSGVDYVGGGHSDRLAEFSDTWIWLSLLLWLLAVGIVLALLVPTLDRATKQIEAQDSVIALTGRVGAAGGVVALLFAAIVVLMVYKPGG
ncbi:hypothetical protein [uncultured Jatrophihabitans sp.]|uniref:hypothetical protein n=1 Tax=uncultured Jatrophihabitans sp. TaxID=1610747 RepID=UPI0035CB8025